MDTKIVKIILIFFILSIFFSCSNHKIDDNIDPSLINNPASASNKDKGKMPKIVFVKTEHNFGEIVDGVKVSYSFKFVNKGNSDLIISNCVPSCGCTVPDFPKKPVKPGQSEFISVVFDSKGRSGTFEKTITVFTNCIPNSTVLRIKGSVVNK